MVLPSLINHCRSRTWIGYHLDVLPLKREQRAQWQRWVFGDTFWVAVYPDSYRCTIRTDDSHIIRGCEENRTIRSAC